jgi:glycosyltransferase involved in cell wall biosynthesis
MHHPSKENMGPQPLVSVVTPFYNTREFLAECIESVLRQTYANWEYVLVNNKSTDGSEEVVQPYVERFPDKIRLIHTDSFLTQVQNYNFALAQISPHSKYCKMVQADDWILPECLESMVAVGEAHPRVALIAAYQIEGDHAGLSGLPYPSLEVPGGDVCRLFFRMNYHLFGTPTSLLMRSEVVRERNPFYDERHAPFEDSHVCFDLLQTWNFGFVHQVLTYSRRDNESILARIAPYQFEYFNRLSIIVFHGRKYLEEDEYQYFFKEITQKYFRFLGRSALQGKDATFWKFHRERLASIGYNANFWFVAKWVSLVILDDLGNPKRTFEYLWPRRKRIFSALSRFVKTMRRVFSRSRPVEIADRW